jgi:hypothetical protein
MLDTRIPGTFSRIQQSWLPRRLDSMENLAAMIGLAEEFSTLFHCETPRFRLRGQAYGGAGARANAGSAPGGGKSYLSPFSVRPDGYSAADGYDASVLREVTRAQAGL